MLVDQLASAKPSFKIACLCFARRKCLRVTHTRSSDRWLYAHQQVMLFRCQMLSSTADLGVIGSPCAYIASLPDLFAPQSQRLERSIAHDIRPGQPRIRVRSVLCLGSLSLCRRTGGMCRHVGLVRGLWKQPCTGAAHL